MSVHISMLHCHLFFVILCCYMRPCVSEHHADPAHLLPALSDAVGAAERCCPCWALPAVPARCPCPLPAASSSVLTRHGCAGTERERSRAARVVLCRLRRGYFSNASHESCFLFRNPTANSLLWSSHLRWSDKYLPSVPGVLYFSHLTEQAPPCRDL